MSTSNLEQRRAAFEEWWETREEAGTAAKYRAFDAWNAALDGVVIELPKPNSDDGDSWDACWKSGVNQCRDAIEAAGVKVKS